VEVTEPVNKTYLRPIQRLTYRTRIPRPIRPARIATTRGRFSVRIVDTAEVKPVKIVATDDVLMVEIYCFDNADPLRTALPTYYLQKEKSKAYVIPTTIPAPRQAPKNEIASSGVIF